MRVLNPRPISRIRPGSNRLFVWKYTRQGLPPSRFTSTLPVHRGTDDLALAAKGTELDRALLEGFRSGDRAVMRRLYDEHLDDVFVVVRRGFILRSDHATKIPGLLSVDDQQDIIQETFIRAFSPTARASFSGTSPFGAYLLQITRNLMVDRARKRKREVMIEDLSDPDSAPLAAIDRLMTQGGPLPREEVDLDEKRRKEAVQAFVLTLDDEPALVYRERFLEGRSERDTATELKQTRRWVRTRHDRLLVAFRAYLEELGMWPPDDDEDEPSDDAVTADTKSNG